MNLHTIPLTFFGENYFLTQRQILKYFLTTRQNWEYLLSFEKLELRRKELTDQSLGIKGRDD